jgi:exopolysaccharide biosynthesis polyprenyl glycosylphosphotransferase
VSIDAPGAGAAGIAAPLEESAEVAALGTSFAGQGATRTRLRRDQLFRRSLLVADLAAFVLAMGLVAAVDSRQVRITWLGLVGILALFVGAKVYGLYDRDEALVHKTTLDEAPKLFQVATLGALCTWLAGGFVLSGGTLPRGSALMLWVLLIVFLVLARASARAFALGIAPTERCLFIGDAAAAATVRGKLADNRGLKAELVSSIDPADSATWSADGASPLRLREIRSLARTLDVQRAVVSADSFEPERMLDLICTMEAVGVKVSVLPRMLEVVGSSVVFDDLDGVTMMGVKRADLTRSSAVVKRGFDLVGAVIGLIAVAPLMLAIALAIRLEGPGPIFFRQRRVGRHGHHFEVFKFRTMVPDAEALKAALADRNEARSGLFKIADDPRITRVGRFLRKSSLDELPQLLNVVRGEMSLVGPRPLILDEDENVKGWYRRRLELMPGITGPWQILGPARVPLREMGAIDYLYVANWSLWGDVKILLRTVRHVLARKGL